MDEPVKKAIAIKYDKQEDAAPKVVAKGQNLIAEKIKEIAEANDIYIKKNSNLAEELYRLNINEEIPEELYEAVAKILVYLYNLKHE